MTEYDKNNSKVNNSKRIRQILNSISGQERIITTPKIYVELLGDYNTAILLNQIIFWSDKSKRKDGYFFKTYDEWEEELCLTKYQVRRSTEKLKKLGFVETKIKKANGSPTLHYKFDSEVFADSIVEFIDNRTLRNLTNESEETKLSLTEEYTEDYTEEYNNTLAHSDERTQKDDKEKELKQRFEAIWKIYPNKKGKRKAFISYKAAVREGTTDDEIKEGIKAYVEECKKKRTTREFMQHGSTFFNQRRWEDDFISVQTTEEIDYEADVREFYQFKNDDDDIDYEEEWKEYLR